MGSYTLLLYILYYSHLSWGMRSQSQYKQRGIPLSISLLDTKLIGFTADVHNTSSYWHRRQYSTCCCSIINLYDVACTLLARQLKSATILQLFAMALLFDANYKMVALFVIEIYNKQKHIFSVHRQFCSL